MVAFIDHHREVEEVQKVWRQLLRKGFRSLVALSSA
jgi:SOS response regulatory protein OraA/RecX